MLRIGCFLAALLIAGAPTQAAQKAGRGQGRSAGAPSAQRQDKEKDRKSAPPVRVFRSEDKSAIVNYYRSLPGGLPPGLAKRGGDLPPGLEKQLRRNGKLPPGLEKRLEPFPPELEMRLPPCPAGVRRGLIGGVAVMWNVRTGLLLDATVLFKL